MGEAFTAVADDATGIYYNPAGMANADGVDLNVTHSEWLMDTRFEQVSIVNEMLGGAVGFSFTGVYYGAMDRYPDYPALVPDGTFSPYDLSCAAGYAMDVLPNLSAGVTAKAHLREDRFRIGDRMGRGRRAHPPEHDRRAHARGVDAQPRPEGKIRRGKILPALPAQGRRRVPLRRRLAEGKRHSCERRRVPERRHREAAYGDGVQLPKARLGARRV